MLLNTPLTQALNALSTREAIFLGSENNSYTCKTLIKLTPWIPFVSGIPDSLSCVPYSKAQDSTFHKQNFSRVPESGFPYMGWFVWTPKSRSNFWPVRSRLSWLARCEHHNCLTFCSKKAWLHACVVTPLAPCAWADCNYHWKKLPSYASGCFKAKLSAKLLIWKRVF